MSHASFIAWANEGRKDAMGRAFSDWLVCREDADGRAIRDAEHRVVYETQAEWLARNGSEITKPHAPLQQALFA